MRFALALKVPLAPLDLDARSVREGGLLLLSVNLKRRGILPNLTSIRIFAALYVLCFHMFAVDPQGGLPHWYDHWLSGGYLGVSLFFVLSGFILAYTSTEPLDRRKFYVSRFARVYPLYIAAAVLALPNFLRHNTESRMEVMAANVFLIQGWFGFDFARRLNGPSWSLSTEAFFYLLFPFVFPFIKRWMPHRLLMLGVLWITAVAPSAIARWWAWRHGSVQLSSALELVLEFPLARLCEFTVGIVYGLAFVEDTPERRTRNVVLAGAVAVAGCGLQGVLPHEVLRNGLLAVPFGWLLYQLAGWHSRFLGSRAMQLGGEISYAVYLLQVPVILGAGVISRRLGVPALHSWLTFALIFPAAYLSYRLIERPGRLLVLRAFHLRSHPDPIPLEAVESR